MIKISTNTAALSPPFQYAAGSPRLLLCRVLATDPAPRTPLTDPLVTGLVPPALDGVTADTRTSAYVVHETASQQLREDVPAPHRLSDVRVVHPIETHVGKTVAYGSGPSTIKAIHEGRREGMWDAKGE